MILNLPGFLAVFHQMGPHYTCVLSGTEETVKELLAAANVREFELENTQTDDSLPQLSTNSVNSLHRSLYCYLDNHDEKTWREWSRWGSDIHILGSPRLNCLRKEKELTLHLMMWPA